MKISRWWIFNIWRM